MPNIFRALDGTWEGGKAVGGCWWCDLVVVVIVGVGVDVEA